MTDWRPIETAPRGGDWVLVYCPENGIYIAHYIGLLDIAGEVVCIQQTASKSSLFNGFSEWRVEFTASHDNEPPDLKPTHWMPLPPPPKEPTE